MCPHLPGWLHCERLDQRVCVDIRRRLDRQDSSWTDSSWTDVLAEHVRQRRSHARAWLATYDYASCIDGYSCSTDSDLLSQIGSTPWTVNEYINRLVVVNPPFSSSKSTADLCRLECPFVGLMAMVDALNPTCPMPHTGRCG